MKRERVLLNGVDIAYLRPKEACGALFECFRGCFLQYWSQSALFDLRIGLLEIGIEMAYALENQTARERTSFIRSYNKQLKNLRDAERFNRIPSRLNLLQQLYDFCLTSDGVGNLSGFSIIDKRGEVLKKNAEFSQIESSSNKSIAV